MSDKNIALEKDYWNNFYSKWVIDVPSQFCVQMLTEIDPTHTVVEFGSGNGRDSHYIAHQGYMVVAMDLSAEAVEKSSLAMEQRDIEHAVFRVGDVSVDGDIADAIATARVKGHGDSRAVVAYSRFVLHSLDDEQESAFMAALARHLDKGDSLFLEFRSLEDAATDKIFGDHYRRYVDTEKLVRSLEQEHGFVIDYCHTGQGMAKYKNEDPFVSRIIARKQ